MGYEIKMIIGKAGRESDEIERDMTKPHKDGSGFEYKRDAIGNYVKTGRKEHYFSVFVIFDLCKLGYQDDALNRLIKQSKASAKAQASSRVYEFYGDGDGNNAIREDLYGEAMWPVPIREVLEAMKASRDTKDPYRRVEWALALLEAMVNDSEGLEVLFYGH